METSDTKSAKAAESPKRCLLALEDGETFAGIAFGKAGTTTGELVFNTSLSGYQEILTDPSYAGQIVTLTYPEIGNYGTNDEDLESRKIFARGLVIRHLSRRYSNWRATASLSEFLEAQGILGISDVDTRAITRHIRDKGAMRSAMSTEILDPAKLVELAKSSSQMEGLDLTEEVTTKEPYKVGVGKYKVAVMDFGVKKSILDQLAARDMALTVYPASAKAEKLLADKPDAVFLSNGPGDPAACGGVLNELPKLISAGLPIFGICLGHQLLCISMGAQTYKLKFGHRGGNQPVKDLLTGKVEITCQNHGFAVAEDTLPENLELTHVNLNDHSVEGFRHKTLPIFGVQYHPESSPGPHDANYLFERFFDLIESHRKVSV
ncbi:MAG TPA: glutamine-hydrolyzing carbamoyl-phosphate synthase small subunit [Candidatus Melainabacteria bacterium]|nr:glutamine-hydrolyzing carbamoyl-phosphate synthase small subunit [Candidatus Melainabacteria bacterium]